MLISSHRLQEEGFLTDCEIIGDDEYKTWQVHRLVLAMHSDTLVERRCSKTCEVSIATLTANPVMRLIQAYQTAEKYTLNLEGWSECAIEGLIRFLYTFDYREDGETVFFHSNIYRLADELDIPYLKTQALAKFVETLWEHSVLSAASQVETIGDLLDGEGQCLGQDLLVDAIANYTIDFGALAEHSDIRDGVLQLANEYPDYGARLIKELGTREGERKDGRV